MNKFEQPNIAPESSVEQKRLPERPFFEEEKVLLEKTGAEIDAASGKELKKPGFKALAAFLTFLVGSTAFADRALAEREAAHKVGDENRIEKNIGTLDLELRNIYRKEEPPFNSQKIIQKLVPEQGLGGHAEFIGLDSIREIAQGGDGDVGEFYSNLLNNEISAMPQAYVRTLVRSQAYSEFLVNVKDLDLRDQEKLIFLQELGNHLGFVYDHDMADRGENVKISDEDMFQALRSHVFLGSGEGGICGNIHTFMLATAKELGFKDVWLNDGISGYDDPDGHIWMGMIAKGADGKEQIIYLDYGRLIATGTLDPVLARGIMERNHRQISLFNSYVGTKGSVLAPVESLAQRTLSRAGGLRGSGAMLEKHLSAGEIVPSSGLELTLDNELTEFKISNDTVGLSYIRYGDENNNPYQALGHLDGVRASLHLGDEEASIDLETTVLHLTIKDLEGGALKQNEIINRLALNFLDSNTLSVGEYGKFVATFGTSIEAAARHLLHKPNAKQDYSDHIEQSTGLRIAFLNPAETKEVYIGGLTTIRPQIGDFEEQKLAIKAALKQFTVGGSVEVQRGVIASAEHKHAELGHGTQRTTHLGVRVGSVGAAVSRENISSEVPSAIPHARRTSLELSKNFPQGELVVYGAKTEKAYASTNDSAKQFGVAMRVVLW